MRNATAYTNNQAVTLDHERAFEELYLRLARWTAEAIETIAVTTAEGGTLDRSVTLLAHMSNAIDIGPSYEIAAAILSLNRFAIASLIRAKIERNGAALEGLPQVFVSLAEIFATISSQRTNLAVL